MASLTLNHALRGAVSTTTRLIRANMATNARDWETTRYLRFENERTRPARDLLSQIPLESPRSIVDVGCGPGNSTELLAARYPNAKLTGMDSSPNMIEKARAVLPDVTFDLGDLRTYTPDKSTDLIYSNAVFQWLQPDERVPAIKRYLDCLPEGGIFAMQVPDNFKEPTHASMREVAGSPPFTEVFASRAAGNKIFLEPSQLYNSLKPFCEHVNIWHVVYQHRLENAEAIVDWFRSTGLRPFLERLDEGQKKEFLEKYLEKIKQHYPTLVDGGVLLRFPRLFVVLTK